VSRAPRRAAWARAGIAALASAVIASGCGASQSASGGGDAVVTIRCNVADAALFIDGRYIAPVGLVRGGVAVSPGHHRLELRHQAYLARLVELELAAKERRHLDAELFPILP
jgi:hypothetical protein